MSFMWVLTYLFQNKCFFYVCKTQRVHFSGLDLLVVFSMLHKIEHSTPCDSWTNLNYSSDIYTSLFLLYNIEELNEIFSNLIIRHFIKSQFRWARILLRKMWLRGKYECTVWGKFEMLYFHVLWWQMVILKYGIAAHRYHRITLCISFICYSFNIYVRCWIWEGENWTPDLSHTRLAGLV